MGEAGQAPGGNLRWAGFFVLLALLAAVAVAVPLVVNLRQQLRPEQLAQARARWREHGPRSYDLEYTVAHNRDPQPERFLVLVRHGRIVLAAADGEVVRLAPAVGLAAGLPAAAFASDAGRDVEAVFAHIEEVLNAEIATGRRNYVTALFDARDGYPRRFVHRVRGGSQREEWNLLLSPPGQSGRTGKQAR
jgi:hypothetical protein